MKEEKYARGSLRGSSSQGEISGSCLDSLRRYSYDFRMKKYSFRTSRIIEASREKVYRAWTNPKLAKRFAAPEGCKTKSFTSDFRVGGDYRTAMQTPYGLMKNKGTFVEIVPGKKIVQTFIWDQPDTEVNFITLEFKARGNKTLLVLSGKNFEIKGEAKGNQEGWASSLEGFSKYFES